MLTTHQIELLHFPSDNRSLRSKCVERLGKLSAHGYLERIEQPTALSEGRKPYLYCLSTKGAQLIADALGRERSELDWTSKDAQLSPLFHRHLIDSNQIRLRLERAADHHHMRVLTWLDERTLRRTHSKDIVTITGPQGARQKVAVIPDGFFILETPHGEMYIFTECDRRTETARATRFEQADWQKKIMGYTEYLRSGLFMQRYNWKNFRVLTVVPTQRRLTTLKEATEQSGGKRRYWFTTLYLIDTKDPFDDPIWFMASANEQVSFFEERR